jgi:hypothetical protein
MLRILRIWIFLVFWRIWIAFRLSLNNTKMGKKFPSMKLIRLIDISTRRKEISLDERKAWPLNSNYPASQEFFLF